VRGSVCDARISGGMPSILNYRGAVKARRLTKAEARCRPFKPENDDRLNGKVALLIHSACQSSFVIWINAAIVCNYRAGVTALNVGRFAGLSAGLAPKRPTACKRGNAPKRPKDSRRDSQRASHWATPR
jgi:hypothetical protein